MILNMSDYKAADDGSTTIIEEPSDDEVIVMAALHGMQYLMGHSKTHAYGMQGLFYIDAEETSSIFISIHKDSRNWHTRNSTGFSNIVDLSRAYLKYHKIIP